MHEGAMPRGCYAWRELCLEGAMPGGCYVWRVLCLEGAHISIAIYTAFKTMNFLLDLARWRGQ